jgi:hypothetical protein
VYGISPDTRDCNRVKTERDFPGRDAGRSNRDRLGGDRLDDLFL